MPEPITLEITDEDVKHRLKTWNLEHWSFSEVDDGLQFECPVDKVNIQDIGSIYEAFKPEWMDVTKDNGYLYVSVDWSTPWLVS